MNYITLEQCSDETLRKCWHLLTHGCAGRKDLVLAEAKRRGIELVDPTYVEQKTESQIWY